jgi:DNA-binding beta-propeller fold protein YncE
MKTLVTAALLLLAWAAAWAQTAPSSTAAPDLGYVAVPDSFTLPAGANFGAVSGVAINSRGNIFVLNRGRTPLMEFDSSGKYLRSIGDGLFSDRAHGLRIDAEDNIWAADGGSHIVIKLSPQGRVLLVLGVKGSSGAEFHFANPQLRLLDEPNDMAISRTGEIFVVQNHGGKGEHRVVKFDKDGNPLKTWGKKGKGPGEFDVPHSIAIDAQGLLYVADRGNGRIQVFDADGNYIRETAHPGTPCGLHFSADGNLYLAHGHTGQVMKLDSAGKVLGVTGRQGKGLGEYGEAHNIAVSRKGDIYIADTLNWRVQKLVPK